MEFITAGESHGSAINAIVSNVPAGINISLKLINSDLERRQTGYGRGSRQEIENDKAIITSGIRHGKTIGSPVAIQVQNKDWENWKDVMAPFDEDGTQISKREVTPRPGHADLVGCLRNNFDDARNVLERASARETAARVAASGIAREFLTEFGIEIYSYVKRIGRASFHEVNPMVEAVEHKPLDIETSLVRCPDVAATKKMVAEIDEAQKVGESLGGIFRVVVTGLAPGIGGYSNPSDRLTSKLAAAIFSIPAVKGVEFGLGFEAALMPGSQVHDPIIHKKGAYTRSSNNAGGLEAGMTTGLPLIITVAMKPIPTLQSPLKTVNMDTLETTNASSERSDVCAVPSCGVVAEAEVAFVLAQAYMRHFGYSNMQDIKSSYKSYLSRIKTASR